MHSLSARAGANRRQISVMENTGQPTDRELRPQASGNSPDKREREREREGEREREREREREADNSTTLPD